ncbi:hypothetical protein TNIN_431741 [Trichonephila inaurata madagascariensis]|uniref:Uncharacterized protein n=1 Tax=Trichonephila inaurata madagascariensis TaxID=2747483 RepID=A0A8X7BWS4_9ARAC|nr:hypothetical protein TNIN_431741 [Trichonephila inaurata madagascariensis]
MGNLPRDRIVPSRPFEKVGLDYTGPIITKPNLKRSKGTLKSYIAIYIHLFQYKSHTFRSCFRLNHRRVLSMSPTIYSKKIQAIRHLE